MRMCATPTQHSASNIPSGAQRRNLSVCGSKASVNIVSFTLCKSRLAFYVIDLCVISDKNPRNDEQDPDGLRCVKKLRTMIIGRVLNL